MLQSIGALIAHHAYIFIAGLVFGLANVIPGVSGGTMAVVFGVYERIIGLIANLRRDFKKELPFLAAFGAGAVVGIFAFAKLMGWILENHPTEANAFFIGVILGSLPMLFNYTFRYTSKKSGRSRYKFKVSNILPLVIAFAIMIPMALSDGKTADAPASDKTAAITETVSQEDDSAAQAESAPQKRAFSVGYALLCVVYGIIAVTTMIIPGISGSFVMLLLGFYEDIITAVHTLDFGVVIPFAIGCVIGLFTVAKLIKLLLARFPHQTYSAILGFVLGSILCIFPGWSAILSLWPILMIILGIAVMFAFSKLPQPESR